MTYSKYILTTVLSTFILLSVGWGCDEETEVELWGECYNIEETISIYLESSGLTGEIPSEIGNLYNLNYLSLHNNQLSGEIPEIICDLTNLKTLQLGNNQLSGEIPLELGQLVNLEKLYLNSNQLTGEIPNSIWNLTNLEYLYLHSNQLTGEISFEIGDLTNLETLFLQGNQLTGEIPPEIGNLYNLNYLNLYNNQLSGEIPESICDIFPNLTNFVISTNYLCPPWPDCLTEEDIGYQECCSGDLPPDPPDVDPALYDYGEVQLGEYVDYVITISNNTCVNMAEVSCLIVNGSPWIFDILEVPGYGEDFSFELDEGESQIVTIRFQPPVGEPGLHEAELLIGYANYDDNWQGEPFIGSYFMGTGIGLPLLEVDTTSIYFGEYLVDGYSTGSGEFTVTNTGTVTLEVTDVSIIGDNSSAFFFGPISDNPFELWPGEDRTIYIYFAPDEPGVLNAQCQLIHNAEGSPASVELGGIGLQPEFSISPTSWDYGTVVIGDYLEKNFIMTNTGTELLTVSGYSCEGENSDQFWIINPGVYYIEPEASDSIIVRYNPNETGVHTTTFTINHNAPGSPVEVPLTGTTPGLLLGDLNEDGNIDILDIVMTVEIILGNTNPTEYQLWAADLNSDGVVDILDIVIIVGIILD